MASKSFRTILGRKLVASGITLVVASGLVGAALLTGIGPGADAATTAVAAASTEDAKSVDPDVAKFRADLKAAFALEGQARIDAVKKIRQDAKAGKYGDKVEKRVERRDKKQAAMWAHAPKELKADLREVRKADPADRPAKRHEVFNKALAGDYGDKAQKRAERLKEFADGAQ